MFPSLSRPHPSTPGSAPRAAAAVLATVIALLAAGCAVPPPPAPVVGLTDLAERPPERALLGAMRSYDDADYPAVERQSSDALRLGLRSPRDQATAHKLRAFVYCTSHRVVECEAEFRAARTADPGFALSRAEAGHPVWGPAYLQSLRPTP
jgi:Tfp pilus assembly protein PilF